MPLRKAKFRLEDLEADEVSLVPKGANGRPFSILKMDTSVDKAERPAKSEGGSKFFASDYAYVPDRNKPSTWKLRLTNTPGGAPDKGIVGAAIAALGKGFRGQKVQIPSADLASTKGKVRAAWLKANPDKKREDLPQVIKEDSVEKDDNALFEVEVFKAELDEFLDQPVEGEEELVNELVEKEGISARAASAFRGAMRLFTGFKEELPNFAELLSPTTDGVAKQNVEDEEMTEDVKKATQTEDAVVDAASSETSEEVEKAKKADDMEEEDEKKKKMPPFMEKKKKSEKEATAKEDSEEGSSKDSEEIFKQYEAIRKENEEIKKLQEETRKELEAEKDARATEQAIQKAANDYPNLPVEAKELGPIVKKVKETLSKEQVETFERILKAADDAVKARKDFEEATHDTVSYGTAGSAGARLKEIAKSLVAKSENKLTDAQAFVAALEQNPQLYDEYLAEQRG